MKRRLFEKHADSGSALILTLLITALLATIAVSFLSTSRIEQIAAKNFTRQNAACGLAELATQQAMGKIQQGFNATGNGTGNFTSVITTQPGAINRYFFSNGTLQTNRTITTELFSSGSGNLSYLNNLQNPSSDSSATSDQWTITGNASERINVFMENITTTVNGSTQLIGRVAYYVDDEGTKLNLNSATGNRTTLNAALRPLDIGALSANYTNIFATIINGTASSNTSNITAWSHFFRPEQLGAAINSAGGNFSLDILPYLTTATSSANSTANMTHLLTPWGTQRIAINTLSTNATNGDGDASVESIFQALTGQNSTIVNGTTTYTTSNSTYGLTGRGLQNVFGGNFSAKYTPLGVKQIVANMLQMRDPNTFSINASGNYSGPLLGSNNLDANGLPNEYLGFAPYPVISEIGFSGMLISEGGLITLNIQPMIEIYNPYYYLFTFNASAPPRISFYIKKVSFTLNGVANGAPFSTNFTVNAPGDGPPPNSNWGWSRWSNSNPEWRSWRLYYDTIFENNGNNTTIGPYKKIQTRPYNNGQGGVVQGAYVMPLPAKMGNFTVTSITNPKIEMYYVKINAKSNAAGNVLQGHENTIRDWVSGNEIGEMDITMKPMPGPMNMIVNPAPTPSDPSSNYHRDLSFQPPWTTPPPSNSAAPVPITSAQRISHITKSLPSLTINDTTRNWTTANNSVSSSWLDNSTTWVTSNSSNFGFLGNGTSSALSSSFSAPSFSANYTIPSDPSLGDSVANAINAGSNASDMREPFLATGNYTCPADLGFVPTNKRWRRLRMQMQPNLEGSMIPDWAMLDVLSFGNSTDPNNAFNRMIPVNINGKFRTPGNATIAPRTIGIQALAKVLERSSGTSILDPMLSASSNTTQSTITSDATRFKGNTINATLISDAIRDMNWAGNSTWDTRRSTRGFPEDQYILPSEIMEIAGVADEVSQTEYNNSNSHFKWNEGRASALIPAVATRSSFFTIYAYAQALDNQQNIDSEALTKTLVEVEIATPATATTPAQYKVKKLYTQPIPLGQ